jgi:hypothetical protein
VAGVFPAQGLSEPVAAVIVEMGEAALKIEIVFGPDVFRFEEELNLRS